MPDALNTNDVNPAAIVAIECDALFGQYTYRLGSSSESRVEVGPQLLLLYGDNGSGKTTIAQLLFHMLSPRDGRGHRSFLARTKFRRFCVRFDNRSSFTAERFDDCLDGSYTLTASDRHGYEESINVRTNDEGVVSKRSVDKSKLHQLLSICSATALDIYFLSDDRALQSDVFDDEPSEELIGGQGRFVTRRIGGKLKRMRLQSRVRDLTVDPSVWRAELWLRRQAIQASSAGEVTTSNIYTDIIERITRASSEAARTDASRLDDVMNSLTDLAKRSKAFTALGLSQPVPIDTLTKHVKSGVKAQDELLGSVLEPYVNSIRSRLDAFAVLQQRLSSFVDIINALYRRKAVRITTTDGIQVFDDNGEQLDVSLLSSGEKQLMLLLCNILVATTEPSLFIIDEPELSLNVKWQRQLVDSLMSLVEGSHVQFIMATHSIEVLTRHQNSVLKLDDTTESERNS